MPERATTPRDTRRRLLRALQKDLGHEFEDLDVLDRALTHASTGNEGKRNYERLEFLGDAFLNFAVADALFQQAPEIPEGQLTETRSQLVSRKPLAAIARRLDLANHLEVGKGLRASERDSERILADLVEAVLGAILLDGGVRAARAFVRRHVLSGQDLQAPVDTAAVDSKTALLHFCQRHKLGQPRYDLVGTTGLQHEQQFRVRANLPDGRAAEGSGPNKRSAEKVAAARLLHKLRDEGRPTEA
ncbi:MAG: ribonuclease III [Planctomycetota bacterium]